MTRLFLAAIAILIAALTIETMRGDRARAAAVQSDLARDSIAAANDTSREVAIAQFHDSIRVVVRRAKQQEQRADALDRALGAERLAQLNAAVRVAALDTVVRSDTVRVDIGGRRRSHFAVRQPPYTVAGDIAESHDGSIAAGDSVSLRVELDSIPLQLRLSCRTAPGSMVRSALVVAAAPPWARIALGKVEQAADVCNHDLAPPSAESRFVSFLRRAGISVGAAVVVDRDGRVTARPAAMLGVRVWPSSS